MGPHDVPDGSTSDGLRMVPAGLVPDHGKYNKHCFIK